MRELTFPPLPLEGWRATRDTLHGYARVLGSIRRQLAPRQRHWAHVTLRVGVTGLETPPIPARDLSFGLLLDLVDSRLVVRSSRGERAERSLHGQPLAAFHGAVVTGLRELGVEWEGEAGAFADENPGSWDREAVGRFWRALVRIEGVFQVFKGARRQETSPVQLFPHHFDLALSWLSGRRVPGEDPANEDAADEQMIFGFSTGDESVAEAYFYATAYPEPEGFSGSSLPAGAHWEEEGFSGAVLPYQRLVGAEEGEALLLGFLEGVHRVGAERMDR
jgi:hypothetical protein